MRIISNLSRDQPQLPITLNRNHPQMAQQNRFEGIPLKNPHAHLDRFLEISNSMKMNRVTKDVIRLQLFTFSLRDKAREWLDSMPLSSITIREQLSQAFFNQFFSPAKLDKLRRSFLPFDHTQMNLCMRHGSGISIFRESAHIIVSLGG